MRISVLHVTPEKVEEASLDDVQMTVDVLPVTKTKDDLHRRWMNSVFNSIDQDGVILDDRQDSKRARPGALYAGPGRRLDVELSAA